MLYSIDNSILRQSSDWDQLLESASDQVPRIALGLVLLLATLVLARVVSRRVGRIRFLQNRDPDLARLLSTLLYLGLLIIGVVTIPTALGISTPEVVGFLRNVVVGLILLVLTFTTARFIKARVLRLPYLTEHNPDIAALFSNLAYVGALGLGIITTLTAVGIDLTAAITVLGVTGLAVSLALQDVLRNFVAGIYILLEQPFNIGDQIALRDVSGDVLTIELRTTRLRTTTGAQVIVPNAVVMTEVVTNRSLAGLQPYVVTVSGGRDLLADGLQSYASLLKDQRDISVDPEPEVVIESLEADKASVRLRFWTGKQTTAVSEVVAGLERRLPDASVTARAEE